MLSTVITWYCISALRDSGDEGKSLPQAAAFDGLGICLKYSFVSSLSINQSADTCSQEALNEGYWHLRS